MKGTKTLRLVSFHREKGPFVFASAQAREREIFNRWRKCDMPPFGAMCHSSHLSDHAAVSPAAIWQPANTGLAPG